MGSTEASPTLNGPECAVMGACAARCSFECNVKTTVPLRYMGLTSLPHQVNKTQYTPYITPQEVILHISMTWNLQAPCVPSPSSSSRRPPSTQHQSWHPYSAHFHGSAQPVEGPCCRSLNSTVRFPVQRLRVGLQLSVDPLNMDHVSFCKYNRDASWEKFKK